MAIFISSKVIYAFDRGHAYSDCAYQLGPSSNTIQIMTVKVSKGLEFPVVTLPSAGHMPAAGGDEQEAARAFYVAATRATKRLVIGVGMGRLGIGLEHDQENNMNETTYNVVPASFDTLHAELRSLIASSRQCLAGAVNAQLTRLYWSVGARLHTAQTFAQPEIVSTLSAKLSWSHFVNLLPHQTEPARQFYASRTKRPPLASSCVPNSAANRWSCCKCTKTASPWPNTGPNYHPKRSWSKSCMQLCLKRASGWRGAGYCRGTWMMSEASISQYDLLIRSAPSTRRGTMQVLMAA
jgi:UvrD-like helicase C-terminal domain